MFGYRLDKVEGPGLADLHDYGGHLSVIDRVFQRIVPCRLGGVCGKLHIDREPLLHRSLFGCDAYGGNAVDPRDQDFIHV